MTRNPAFGHLIDMRSFLAVLLLISLCGCGRHENPKGARYQFVWTDHRLGLIAGDTLTGQVWRYDGKQWLKFAELPQNLPRKQFLFKGDKLMPVKNTSSVINEVTLPDGTVLEIEAPAERRLKVNEIQDYIKKQERARVESSVNPFAKLDSYSDAELEAIANAALQAEQVEKAYDPATYRKPPATKK